MRQSLLAGSNPSPGGHSRIMLDIRKMIKGGCHMSRSADAAVSMQGFLFGSVQITVEPVSGSLQYPFTGAGTDPCSALVLCCIKALDCLPFWVPCHPA